jgi:TPR repeat protein
MMAKSDENQVRFTVRAPIIATLAAATLALSAVAPSAAQASDDERADLLYEEAEAFQQSGDTAQARARFTQSCDLGHYGGCREAAPMWALGDGGSADRMIAIRMYQGMCTINNDTAGCLAAELTANPSSAPAEALHMEAERLFAEGDRSGLNFAALACRLGHAPACLTSAANRDRQYVHYDREGHLAACGGFLCVEVSAQAFTYHRNNPEVVRDLARACDLGSGEGCVELGDMFTPLGLFGAPFTPENWHGAVSAYRRACEDHQVSEGCERHRRLMEHRRSPGESRLPETSLDCAAVLFLMQADGPQFAERAAAEARAAVQAHVAAFGGDRVQLGNQVVETARVRMQAIQSRAERPEVVREEVQACRTLFGFQP